MACSVRGSAIAPEPVHRIHGSPGEPTNGPQGLAEQPSPSARLRPLVIAEIIATRAFEGVYDSTVNVNDKLNRQTWTLMGKVKTPRLTETLRVEESNLIRPDKKCR